jgi:hypothetical protein
LLRKDLQQRLAGEYRFAVDRMKQETVANRKLYYFSVFYGEAARVLNWQWDRDLALVHNLAQLTYNQLNSQLPMFGQTLPIDASIIFAQLDLVAADLASYYEKMDKNANREELFNVLGHLAEIGYLAGGNGTYLYEKGVIKF